MRRARLLIAVTLLVSACGPTVAINAGLKQAGANIYFGRPAASPAPIPIQVPALPAFPQPIELPPFQFPTFQLRCPVASPLAFPKHEASQTSLLPPVPGTYEYRYKGAIIRDPGKPDAANQVQFSAPGHREVAHVSPVASDGHYSFDVVETLGPFKQTNSYVVYPVSQANSTLPSGVSPDSGIYLTQMQIVALWGSRTFRPATPIELMTLPAQNGVMALRGGGSDGNTTLQINPANPQDNLPPPSPGPSPSPSPSPAPGSDSSFNAGTTTVDACGTPLQAWKVLLAGTIATTTGTLPNETFSLELDFGTQYGCISLNDLLIVNWTDPTTQKPMEYKINATADQEPALPK